MLPSSTTTVISTIQKALLFIFLSVSAIAQESKPRLVLVELERSKGVNLKTYGGSDIEIRMKNREMSYVGIEIIDYTNMVPVARTNISGVTVDNFNNTATVYGSTDATMVPTRTSIRVEKRNTVNYSATNHDMFLAYEDPSSRIRVYFLDSIARQNFDNFVIAIPREDRLSTPPATPSIPISTPAPVPHTPVLSTPSVSPYLSPALASWYTRLQSERRLLDLSDHQAVERFNEHAAQYQDALKKARAAADALKLAPK